MPRCAAEYRPISKSGAGIITLPRGLAALALAGVRLGAADLRGFRGMIQRVASPVADRPSGDNDQARRRNTFAKVLTRLRKVLTDDRIAQDETSATMASKRHHVARTFDYNIAM